MQHGHDLPHSFKNAETSPTYPSSTLVELHVPDFQTAYDFYKRLGFGIVWFEDEYMVLGTQANVLCFYGGGSHVTSHSYFRNFPGDTPRGFGVEIIIFCEDLPHLYESFRGDDALVTPLKRRPWGVSDFRVVDPFGFYIRLSEPYDCVMRADKIRESQAILRAKNFKL